MNYRRLIIESGSLLGPGGDMVALVSGKERDLEDCRDRFSWRKL